MESSDSEFTKFTAPAFCRPIVRVCLATSKNLLLMLKDAKTRIFFPCTCDLVSQEMMQRHFFPILHHLSPVILATATVVAFALLRNSRFNCHFYTQPAQKSALKWWLWPFTTSCTKDYQGHSLVQTSFTELPNNAVSRDVKLVPPPGTESDVWPTMPSREQGGYQFYILHLREKVHWSPVAWIGHVRHGVLHPVRLVIQVSAGFGILHAIVSYLNRCTPQSISFKTTKMAQKVDQLLNIFNGFADVINTSHALCLSVCLSHTYTKQHTHTNTHTHTMNVQQHAQTQ